MGRCNNGDQTDAVSSLVGSFEVIQCTVISLKVIKFFFILYNTNSTVTALFLKFILK